MKRILIFVFLVFATVTALFAQIQNGRVFYYQLDGNGNDISANGLHGTVVGATPTLDRNGNPNSAYLFDGVNDEIVIPHSSLIKVPLPATVSMWFRVDQFPTTASTGIFYNNFTQDHYDGFLITVAPFQKIVLAYGDGNAINYSTNARAKTIDYVLQPNTWYHLVAIFRGPTDMDGYIDCVLRPGTYSGSGGAIHYNLNPGTIGKADCSLLAPVFFQGAIDEVMFWNRALTAGEAQSLCDPCQFIDTIYATLYDTITVYDTVYTTVYDTLTVTVEDTLNIRLYITGMNPPNNFADILVYPNPTQDQVFVSVSNPLLVGNYHLQITNASGMTIWQHALNQSLIAIPANSFGASGLYFLKFFDQNGTLKETRKLILQ